MSDENELLEPLATEAGQQAIARAINNLSSLEYAVRAERAATNAAQRADEALNSATAASSSEEMARKWATKTDGAVAQETIEIPPEQEGDDPTTETINLYSARYYAALAEETYNNMQFDSEPTENSTKLLSSGTIYTALYGKADKSTTYTKTEVDTQISTAVSNLVNSAPSTLDTLEELADALGDDPNFATTIATQLGNKADKSDTYTKTEVDTALGNVQSTLTFDNVPTANSDNPVKSSGIKTALDGKQDTLTFDSTPTANSTNPVTSGGVYTALQNVDIDVDTSITQNSTNPVTSAAIYAALQNAGSNVTVDSTVTENSQNPVTSAGIYDAIENAVRAGSLASGIVEDVLFEDSTGVNSGTINLSGNISDYDLIVFGLVQSGGNYSQFSDYIYTSERVMQHNTTNNQSLIVTTHANYYIGFRYATDTQLNIIGYRESKVVKITGIKFSKNLSEQMYSNVLYENSSGWSSGSINLNDALDNYDFIEFQFGNNSDVGHLINSVIDAKVLYDRVGQKYDIIGYSNRYFNFVITSKTQLTYDAREWYVVYKIIGHKMAKGGYSGIVSDARMTVKSGTVVFSKSIGDMSKIITFDSPMPDANYEVVLSRSIGGAYWNHIDYGVIQKTVNGFTIIAYSDASQYTNNPQVDWIAIRPNSYTREGMVEDVLFYNASGVNSGTINLSGNISDYDLIQFDVTRGNSPAEIISKVISSSTLINIGSNDFYLVDAFDNDYFDIKYTSDSTLTIGDNRVLKLLKITGIKFGRYVSGVAVDTTITSSGTGVPSTNAVYQALQNIPSGGGGGGSITIDSVPTENSQNAVSSGGVYTALQNLPSGGPTNIYTLKTHSLQPTFTSLYLADEEDQVLYTSGGRAYYKYSDGNAICGITVISGYRSSILVSTEENNVRQYNSEFGKSGYAGSVINSFLYNGVTWYYTCGVAGWGASVGYTSDFPDIDTVGGTYTTAEELALQLLKSANVVLSDSNPIEEDLFYPTNFNLSTNTTITNSTLKSLINGHRPIKINGYIYYPYYRDTTNSIVYYSTTIKSNNTSVTKILSVNSSWVVTLEDLSGGGGSSITVDSTITQGGTNPVTGGAIYTALGDKADKSTTYTKTEVDTAVASKGDVTTDTNQNITGTKTFVGSKKVAFKQSSANDKLGFTLFGNTGTERGYLEFNPTNTVDGVAGLMTLGNYATSAAGLTQVGFRRYSNISGASGAYNLLMPMVADARTPFSLTTSYQNFYLPLGFTDGTTTVRTAKSGVVDLSPLLASLEARIAALEGN